MNIPRIIHQTCNNPAALPEEIIENIEKIKTLNPRWQYRIYSDADVFDYFSDNLSPKTVDTLQRINPKYGVVLADLFRYLMIYHTGGVYLDIKSTMSRPLDEVIREDDVYLLSQWRNRLGEEFVGAGLYPELTMIPGGELQQWHVIAQPDHPFLSRVISQVIDNLESYNANWFGVGKVGVLRLSGPICYTLSILPIIVRHPYRLVDIQNLGFAYSLYKELGRKNYHADSQSHYSKATEPIVADRM